MSKILEEVKNLRTSCYRDDRMVAISMPYFDKFLDNLEKELKEKEKQDKALEIIKKKNVNILEIKLCNDYEEYNRCASGFDVEELTQEEFDLLKEVLK